MRITKKALALLLFSAGFICTVGVSAYVLWKTDVLDLPMTQQPDAPVIAPVEQEDALYPVMAEDGLWGYIDGSGTMVISPVYEEARPFWGRAAWVKQNGLWGSIDAGGSFLVRPEYDEIVEYRDDESVFVAALDNVLSAASVSSSLYDVNGTKLFGLSGQLGEMNDGLMSFSRQKGEQQAWGYINAHGEIIIEPQYAEVGEVSGNYALVRDFDGQTLLLNIHAKTGTPLEGVDSLDAVGNRRVLMRQGEKFGYLNVGGELIVDYIYDAAEPFRDGAALVAQQGLYGLLTADGAYALAPQFASGRYLGGGMYAMKLVEQPGWRIYNTLGESVLEDTVYDIGDWVDGLLACQTQSGTCFLNTSAEVAEEFALEHQPGVFRLGQLYGIVDDNGQVWFDEERKVIYSVGRDRTLTEGVELRTVAENEDAAYMVYYPQIETTEETDGAAWRHLNSTLADNALGDYMDEYRTRGELNYTVRGDFELVQTGAVATVVQRLQLDDSWDAAGSVEQVVQTVCFDTVDGRQYALSELFGRNVNWRVDLLEAARAAYTALCAAEGQQENPEVQEILSRRLSRNTLFSLDEQSLTLYISLSDGSYLELPLNYGNIATLLDEDGELWQRMHLQ